METALLVEAKEFLECLRGTLREHEDLLRKSGEAYTRAKGKGEDPVFRIGERKISSDDVIDHFFCLHYHHPELHAVSGKPKYENLDDTDCLRVVIRDYLWLFRQLGVAHDKLTPEITEWLGMTKDKFCR
ncbi:MAG TPA: hypothetical protein VF817_04670 [Patescibacteria group bacterium]